jgi:hypothetical protein
MGKNRGNRVQKIGPETLSQTDNSGSSLEFIYRLYTYEDLWCVLTMRIQGKRGQ